MQNHWRRILPRTMPRPVKYLAASGIALLIDYAAYLVILKWTPAAVPVAAALGYGAGLLAAYVLITAFVFEGGWLRGNRPAEAALFALSGMLGLALTYATSALCVKRLGNDVHLAKLAAVLVSFSGVYLFRMAVVFRR